MAITLSERAAQELKTLLEESGIQNAGLRVWVAGGGCCGLQYQMAIDDAEPEETDLVFDSHGVKIYVDSLSIRYMDGRASTMSRTCSAGGSRSTTRTPSAAADAVRRSRPKTRWERLAQAAAVAVAADRLGYNLCRQADIAQW
jgi:iron-sulfur cluster assembly accessory protein